MRVTHERLRYGRKKINRFVRANRNGQITPIDAGLMNYIEILMLAIFIIALSELVKNIKK